MPWKMRVVYPGAIYHRPLPRLPGTDVMSRENRQDVIVPDELDRLAFLEALPVRCQKAVYD